MESGGQARKPVNSEAEGVGKLAEDEEYSTITTAQTVVVGVTSNNS